MKAYQPKAEFFEYFVVDTPVLDVAFPLHAEGSAPISWGQPAQIKRDEQKKHCRQTLSAQTYRQVTNDRFPRHPQDARKDARAVRTASHGTRLPVDRWPVEVDSEAVGSVEVSRSQAGEIRNRLRSPDRVRALILAAHLSNPGFLRQYQSPVNAGTRRPHRASCYLTSMHWPDRSRRPRCRR